MKTASSRPASSACIIGSSPGIASIRPGRAKRPSRSTTGCASVSRPANQAASSTPTPASASTARVQVLPLSCQPVTPIRAPARSSSRLGPERVVRMQRCRKPRMRKQGNPDDAQRAARHRLHMPAERDLGPVMRGIVRQILHQRADPVDPELDPPIGDIAQKQRRQVIPVAQGEADGQGHGILRLWRRERTPRSGGLRPIENPDLPVRFF
ncbi:hypothetical protein [Cereibacter changlensis]|uniref:hypothetical protein n=1 Tax=Cereibacter changlensis TaxID=402884 RepID=UPI00403465B9